MGGTLELSHFEKLFSRNFNVKNTLEIRLKREFATIAVYFTVS